MKFKGGLLLFAVVVGIVPVCDVMAKDAPAGKYRQWATNNDCPSGCYCKGGSNFNWAAGNVPKGCKNRWNKVNSDLCNKGHGVCLCPVDFQKSDSGAKTEEECYTYVNGNKLYNKNTTCPGGQYLPASSNKCAGCPEGFVCRGGTWHVSFAKDQGKDTCPSGSSPNSTQMACIEEAVVNQDVVEEVVEVVVPAGSYLPANKEEPQSCKNLSSKQFCPGGVFEKSDVKQGIFDCPYTASDDHSKCTLTLTDAQMKYGIAGGKSGNKDAKCWIRTDPQDYKKCVMGTK